MSVFVILDFYCVEMFWKLHWILANIYFHKFD